MTHKSQLASLGTEVIWEGVKWKGFILKSISHYSVLFYCGTISSATGNVVTTYDLFVGKRAS